MVQTLGEVPDSFAVTAEHTDRLAAQAERLSQGELLRAIDLLAAALAAVKEGSEPRLQLEVALLKATQPQADQSLQALMFRIDQLEARLGRARRRRPAAGRGGAPRRRLRGAGARTEAPRAEAARVAASSGAAAWSPRGGVAAAAVATARAGCRGRAEPEPVAAGRSTSSASRACGARWPRPCASRTRWSPRWSPRRCPRRWRATA